jgi:hypothetical protein
MLIPNIDMMNNLIINPDLFGSQTEQEAMCLLKFPFWKSTWKKALRPLQ